MISIVCILYNKRISEIKSIDNFLLLKRKYSDIEINIYDNSNTNYKDLNQEEYRVLYSDMIRYISNNGNIGLSKTYNKAIVELNEKDYILVADDDTLFSIEYLTNAINAVNERNELIVSGMVKSRNKIISPIKKLVVFNKPDNFIKKHGYYDDIYCINSGLLINVGILQKVGRYDEDLFLDFVDNSLMERLMTNGLNKILIVNGGILQNFSGFDYNQNKKKLMHRYIIFRKDFSIFCQKYRKSIIYRDLILIKRKCGLFVRIIFYYAKMLANKSNR